MGDRVDTNVVGAAAAGMTPVWLCPTGARGLASPGAELVVSDWQEVTRRFLDANPELCECVSQSTSTDGPSAQH